MPLLEEAGLLLQPLHKCGIGLTRLLRGGSVDNRQNRFISVGECPVNRKFSLAPIKVLRD